MCTLPALDSFSHSPSHHKQLLGNGKLSEAKKTSLLEKEEEAKEVTWRKLRSGLSGRSEVVPRKNVFYIPIKPPPATL